MTEKYFCVECGARVKFDVGQHQWICCGTGEPVLWIPQQQFEEKVMEAVLKGLNQACVESKDSPITPKVRKLADEIKALQEEYFLTFNEALRLIRYSRPF